MGGTLHAALQSAILVETGRIEFRWPGLSPSMWSKLQADAATADRIEFVGDALVRSVIALEVYNRFPTATPHLYTTLTQALTTNLTFYHLLEKPTTYTVGCQSIYGKHGEVEMTSRPVTRFTQVSRTTYKPGGDKFESVLGAFYLERGFEELQKWIIALFDPLITAAYREYTDFHKLRAFKNLVHCKRPYDVNDRSINDHPDKRYRPSSEQELSEPRSHGSSRSVKSLPVRSEASSTSTSWWQKLAAAAGQTLGAGSFQNYQFTFQVPSPVREQAEGLTLRAANITQPPQMSSSRTASVRPAARPAIHTAQSSMNAGSSTPVASRMRQNTYVTNSATAVAHTAMPSISASRPESSIVVPKSTTPIVIDLTLDDDEEELPASAAIEVAAHQKVDGQTREDVQKERDRHIEVIYIDDDEDDDDEPEPEPAAVDEPEHLSEEADASIMDLSFGDADYTPLPTNNEDVGDVSSPEHKPCSKPGEDELDMAEVESLLDWIAELGPMVDRVVLPAADGAPSADSSDSAGPVAGTVSSTSDKQPETSTKGALVTTRPTVSVPLRSRILAKAKSQFRAPVDFAQSFLPAFTSPIPSPNAGPAQSAFSVVSFAANIVGSPTQHKDTTRSSGRERKVRDENTPIDMPQHSSDTKGGARGALLDVSQTRTASRRPPPAAYPSPVPPRRRYSPYATPPPRREPLRTAYTRYPPDNYDAGGRSCTPVRRNPARSGRYDSQYGYR